MQTAPRRREEAGMRDWDTESLRVRKVSAGKAQVCPGGPPTITCLFVCLLLNCGKVNM